MSFAQLSLNIEADTHLTEQDSLDLLLKKGNNNEGFQANGKREHSLKVVRNIHTKHEEQEAQTGKDNVKRSSIHPIISHSAHFKIPSPLQFNSIPFDPIPMPLPTLTHALHNQNSMPSTATPHNA
jgi:hypothetical protein